MSTPHYVIRGGMEGRERLRVLARVMAPTTSALLTRVGVEPTARCLDVGCGGGDVSFTLARLASRGSVVGIDLDETKLGMAREEADAAGVRNVAFRIRDVTEPSLDGDRFDVVYARFLLTHLPDPGGALANLCGQLRARRRADRRGHRLHRTLLRAPLTGLLALCGAVHQHGPGPWLRSQHRAPAARAATGCGSWSDRRHSRATGGDLWRGQADLPR